LDSEIYGDKRPGIGPSSQPLRDFNLRTIVTAAQLLTPDANYERNQMKATDINPERKPKKISSAVLVCLVVGRLTVGEATRVPIDLRFSFGTWALILTSK
jgi:hypothetical protein